ncbi:MAG: glycosyltransferase family 4 protein [Chloroflexi bacterium]|nr:glycosyltransferase family 4 protein [Chloroflexota bacterium]
MSPSTVKSLKIIMAVANNTYPADARVHNEAQTLVDAGHEVTVIALKGPDQSYHDVVADVRVIRFPIPLQGNGALTYSLEFIYVTAATALMVLYAWGRYGLDVLHVHNPPDTLFLAGLLPKLAGKKLIYDHHDLAPELFLTKFHTNGGVLYRLLLLLEKWSCRVADEIIATNESYMANNVQRNGVCPDRVTVVRNGPSLRSLEPVMPDEEVSTRARTIIGYLGHIAYQDGVDHLIKALYHMQELYNYDDWYAVIIGPGDDLESLMQLAESLNIRDKIWFTGYQPEPRWRELLSSVDVCFVPDPANPLNEKSTMMKMMDYMALGKPIVAYDLTENRISGGDAVLYARPGEPEDLARQLMRLIEDESLRKSLGEEGRRRIQSHLAWEYSAENLRNLYEPARMQ